MFVYSGQPTRRGRFKKKKIETGREADSHNHGGRTGGHGHSASTKRRTGVRRISQSDAVVEAARKSLRRPTL